MPKTDKPELSLVIPVYNRAGPVRKTIRSLGLEPFVDDMRIELIIVDDGSQDGSAEVVRREVDLLGYNAITRVIEQANAGPGAARNTGAQVARADTLIFIDSDDYWFPSALDVCIAALQANPDATLFFLPVQDVNGCGEEKVPAAPSRRILRFSSFLEAVNTVRSTRFASCNLMMSRKVLMDAGGFTTEFRCSEDSDLFLRVGEEGPCIVIDGAPVVAHVVGEGDHLSNKIASVAEGLYAMMERNAEGLYPGRSEWRQSFFAGAVVYTCRTAFAQGEIVRPYRLMFKHMPLLFKGGQSRWTWRLLLFPVLSLLSPKSYFFGKKQQGKFVG